MTVTAKCCPRCGGHVVFIKFTLSDDCDYLHDFACKECGHLFEYSQIAGAVVDLLRRSTETPAEAYMVLHFVMLGFEESYGIRGGIVMEHGDEKH